MPGINFAALHLVRTNPPTTAVVVVVLLFLQLLLRVVEEIITPLVFVIVDDDEPARSINVLMLLYLQQWVKPGLENDTLKNYHY